MSAARAEAQHRVRQVSLRVRGVPTAAQALHWRSMGRAVADDALAPVLQQVLDEAAAVHGLGTRTLHLPRLSLALTLHAPDDLLPRLRQALAVAIGEAVISGRANGPPSSTAQRARAQWLHYLAHGRLPWFDDAPDSQLPLQALREAASEWLHGLAGRNGQAPWADGDALVGWPRWSARAQTATIVRLLRMLDAAGQAQLRRLAQEALADSTTQAPATRAEAPDAMRQESGGAARPGSAEDDLAQQVDRWWRLAADPVSARPAPAAQAQTPPGEAARRSQSSNDDTTNREPPPQPAADATPSRQAPQTAPGDAAEPGANGAARWLAHDAGLVLLHPFLPTLFQSIGCLSPDGRQLAAHALPRAAAMLGWLLHGRDAVHEFELTLGRLLLGLAPDEALPLPLPEAQVDDTLRSEGMALLAAVVQHWSALGQTAPASLRAAFLARDGRLWRPAGQPWQLQVADEAYDLLLARLPWAIGTVRLPWMPAPLQVQWGRA